MSQYIVSARKYRPRKFDEVVGQQHVSKTLKNALKSDQLAHAFLFCGPRGVGKTTIARILAKVINCQNVGEDFEPCGTCPSCEAINHNASFNIFELDAASNNSVDDIRYLNEQVRVAPHQGAYKVFIIDEVHMLSSAAFNAFLKTLEEPPSYAIFILATTEKHKIIPTILSRCQIYDFRRILVKDIVNHLINICTKEGITADKEALHIIGERADGALRDALSIFDRMVSSTEADKKLTYRIVVENLHVLDSGFYISLVEQMLLMDVGRLLEIFNDALYRGFDPEIFINGLASHFRNLLVSKHKQIDILLDVSDELKSKIKDQADMIPYDLIVTWLDICNDLDIHYRMARNKILHVEMGLIRIVTAGIKSTKTVSLPEVNDDQKKKLVPPTPETPENILISEKNDEQIIEEPAIGNELDIEDNLDPIPKEELQLIDNSENEIILDEVEEESEEDDLIPFSSEMQEGEDSYPLELMEDFNNEYYNDREEYNFEEENNSIEKVQAFKEPLPEKRSVDKPKTPISRVKIKSDLSVEFGVGKVPDLAGLQANARKNKRGVTEDLPKLDDAELQKIWNDYTTSHDSQLVQANLALTAPGFVDEENIIVRVGTNLVRSVVQNERELLDLVRNHFKRPNLSFKIIEDEDLAPEEKERPVILNAKQKLESMAKKNPKVLELIQKLHLKINE